MVVLLYRFRVFLDGYMVKGTGYMTTQKKSQFQRCIKQNGKLTVMTCMAMKRFNYYPSITGHVWDLYATVAKVKNC